MKKLNDRIFDLMLEEASQQYVEQIAAEYPSAEELKGRYTFSPEFEIWVESVIQTEDNRLKRIGYKKSMEENFESKSKSLYFYMSSFFGIVTVSFYCSAHTHSFIEFCDRTA